MTHLQSRWFPALAGVALLALAIQGQADPRETLGAGDSIRVTVFQNPDLTTETRISERGTIMFPLIGEVALAGQTPTGGAVQIAEQLKQGNYIRNPQVSLSVTQVRSRQVSVLGQVGRPGRYALDDVNSKLTDILALAGGISPAGDDVVTVTVARGSQIRKLATCRRTSRWKAATRFSCSARPFSTSTARFSVQAPTGWSPTWWLCKRFPWAAD